MKKKQEKWTNIANTKAAYLFLQHFTTLFLLTCLDSSDSFPKALKATLFCSFKHKIKENAQGLTSWPLKFGTDANLMLNFSHRNTSLVHDSILPWHSVKILKNRHWSEAFHSSSCQCFWAMETHSCNYIVLSSCFFRFWPRAIEALHLIVRN